MTHTGQIDYVAWTETEPFAKMRYVRIEGRNRDGDTVIWFEPYSQLITLELMPDETQIVMNCQDSGNSYTMKGRCLASLAEAISRSEVKTIHCLPDGMSISNDMPVISHVECDKGR